MSAIGAILSFDSGFNVPFATRRIVQAGSDLSPDGANDWQGHRIGIAHCHFCVTPEDETVSQPLHDANGRFTIAFDGWIDNRPELEHLIQQDVVRPDSALSDAELLLIGYRTFETQVFSMLVGDFAAIIWDSSAEKLICVRDAMGRRPLVYHHDSRRFVCSSLLRQVFSVGDVSRNLSHKTIGSYLSAAPFDPGETFFSGIHRVPPGHWLEVQSNGHLSVHRYWHPSKISLVRSSNEDIEARFRECFFQAVGARLRTTKPLIAIQVSGGIDSSAVVAAVHHLNDTANLGLTTIALQNVAQHPAADERHYQRSVLAKYPMLETTTAAEDYWAFRDPGIPARFQEEPFEGNYAARMIADLETAKRMGAQIVLTGDGGDEIGGNSMYLIDRLLRGHLRGWWSELTQRATGRHISRGELIRVLAGTAKAHLRRRFVSTTPRLPPWMNQSFARSLPVQDGSHVRAAFWNPVREDTFQRLQYFWLDPHYSVESAIYQTYGVEVRQPFLDRRVVEWALSVPTSVKGDQGNVKAPIRRALSELLPEAVLKRNDKGNYLHYWDLGLRVKERDRILQLLDKPISAELGFIDAHVLRESYRKYCEGNSINRRQLWSALTLEKWLRRTWASGH